MGWPTIRVSAAWSCSPVETIRQPEPGSRCTWTSGPVKWSKPHIAFDRPGDDGAGGIGGDGFDLGLSLAVRGGRRVRGEFTALRGVGREDQAAVKGIGNKGNLPFRSRRRIEMQYQVVSEGGRKDQRGSVNWQRKVRVEQAGDVARVDRAVAAAVWPFAPRAGRSR